MRGAVPKVPALAHAVEGVAAVGVGDGGALRAADLHRGADERVALSVEQAARDGVALGCPAAVLSAAVVVDLDELSLGRDAVGQRAQQLSDGLGRVGLSDVGCHLLAAEVAVVEVDLVIA